MFATIGRSSTRLALRQPPVAAQAARGFAAASDPGAIRVDLTDCYEVHNFSSFPTETYTTKEELVEYFKMMYIMRRMEITCDIEYKAKNIRGFCHLYDGQEAVGMGVQTALDNNDSWITSYRCHCVALLRGGTVASVLGELFGMKDGHTGGKGGSMHFYNKKNNFYGGQGIVGAQVPVGTGCAFANKYNTPPGEKMPVAFAAYGDGAANQGQIWESANMASLWKLPMIFCCENNHYGMGTSTDRHSSLDSYYRMGNHIPGMKIDGQNVFAVREGMAMIKEFCSTGNGPMFVEMNTYRYHGHSMSDPGKTYRTPEQVNAVRKNRDPIQFVKNMLIEQELMSEAEVKDLEKMLRKEVEAEVAKAKASSPPGPEELATNI